MKRKYLNRFPKRTEGEGVSMHLTKAILVKTEM